MDDGNGSRLRDDIRRDMINSWHAKHPDAEPPETLRQLSSLWFDEQVKAVQDLPEKRADQLKLHARMRASRVRELRTLDDKDVETTAKAVHAAHWTENSRASLAVALEEWVDDHVIMVIVPMLLIIMLFFRSVFPWLVQPKDFQEIGGAGIVAGLIFLVLLLVIHGRILMMWRSVAPKLVQIWRLLAVGVAAYLLVDDRILHHVQTQALRQRQHIPKELHKVIDHFDFYAIYTLRWFTTFISVALIISAGASLLNRMGPKEPAHAVTTSSLLLEILELSLHAQAALDTLKNDSDQQGFRPYLVSEERKSILRCLDRIARTAEGRWRRSLRIGDPIADNAISSLGEGIAASARKWKIVAATGGEMLEEMNMYFSRALVDAAKGNWELLASEVSGRELFRRRMFRTIRHFAALFVMLGSAYMVLVDPLGLLTSTTSPAISSLLLTFAAILSVSIDPTIVERLGTASKIGANFSAKK